MGFFSNVTSWFKPAKLSPTKTPGGPNTANYGGWVTTSERASDLIGPALWETIGNMMRTAEIGHPLRKRQALASRPKVSAERASDSPEAHEYAEKLELILDQMRTPWPQLVRRMSLYDAIGHYVGVWTAERREDGMIGIRDVRPIAQSTIQQWAQDETGEVIGCVQRSPQTLATYDIDRSRMVYLVDNSFDDSPTGLGLLRQAAESFRVLREYGRFEGIGFQTNLAGMPKVSLPMESLMQQLMDPQGGNMSREQALAQIEVMKAPWRTFIENHNVASKRGVILDSSVHKDVTGNPTGPRREDLEIMVNAGGPHAEVAAAYVRLLFIINRLFGTDGDLLGSESTGTYALAKERTTHLMLVVESILREICTALDRDLVTPLWLLNGWPEEHKPRLKTDPLQRKDVAEVMGVIEGLARAGVTLQVGDPAVDVARGMADLPPTPEVDPIAEGLLDRITTTEDDGSVEIDVDDDKPETPEEMGGDEKPAEKPEYQSGKRKRRR